MQNLLTEMTGVLKGNALKVKKRERERENAFDIFLIWVFDSSIQEDWRNTGFCYCFFIM